MTPFNMDAKQPLLLLDSIGDIDLIQNNCHPELLVSKVSNDRKN